MTIGRNEIYGQPRIHKLTQLRRGHECLTISGDHFSHIDPLRLNSAEDLFSLAGPPMVRCQRRKCDQDRQYNLPFAATAALPPKPDRMKAAFATVASPVPLSGNRPNSQQRPRGRTRASFLARRTRRQGALEKMGIVGGDFANPQNSRPRLLCFR